MSRSRPGETSDVSSSTEVVLGEIPAVVRLALGSERLKLFVSTTRIIVAHIGKSGAGAVATRTFFGWLSEGLESLFRSPRESSRKRRLGGLTPGEILAADKDNFSINYDEIVNVEITGFPHMTVITMLTKEDKWEFRTGMNFDGVVGLLGRVLADKIATTRSGTIGPTSTSHSRAR